MKSTKINSDENAWIGTLLNIVLIILIAGLVLFVYDLIASGDIADLAEDAGGGLWGGIVGATAGFFGGAWQTGKDIGNATYPKWINRFKWW